MNPKQSLSHIRGRIGALKQRMNPQQANTAAKLSQNPALDLETRRHLEHWERELSKRIQRCKGETP